MAIGISEEHEALRESARDALARHCPPSVPRALLDAADEELPAFWTSIADLGWLGLHVEEEYGGSGYGLPELVVACEEMGRAATPGPFVPTMLAAAIVAAAGSDEQRKELLPGLVDGSTPAAVGFSARAVDAELDGESLRLSGLASPVVGASMARLLFVPAQAPDGVVWCIVDAADVG